MTTEQKEDFLKQLTITRKIMVLLSHEKLKIYDNYTSYINKLNMLREQMHIVGTILFEEKEISEDVASYIILFVGLYSAIENRIEKAKNKRGRLNGKRN